MIVCFLSCASIHCWCTNHQDGICLLPGDRLLAFSEEHMMIYSFAILEGVEFTLPTFVPRITEPRWKLLFAGTRTDRGALSEGLLNETATYFVVKAINIHGLIIPHNENEAPHFYLLMELDSSRCPTCSIGFERAFIQHEDRSITRPNFSWEVAGENGNTCDTLVFKDYPTTCNGAQIPQLDEETGRIVQVLRDGFRVIDTALVYAESDELEEDLYFSLWASPCSRQRYPPPRCQWPTWCSGFSSGLVRLVWLPRISRVRCGWRLRVGSLLSSCL